VAPRKRGYNAGPVDAAMDPGPPTPLPVFQQREGLLDSRSFRMVVSGELIMLAVGWDVGRQARRSARSS
jgi:hypothetical protein